MESGEQARLCMAACLDETSSPPCPRRHRSGDKRRSPNPKKDKQHNVEQFRTVARDEKKSD